MEDRTLFCKSTQGSFIVLICPSCGKTKKNGTMQKPWDALTRTGLFTYCIEISSRRKGTRSRQLFYTCEVCSATHAHKKGDYCVFCSYADKPCPSMQEGETGCSSDLSDYVCRYLQRGNCTSSSSHERCVTNPTH